MTTSDSRQRRIADVQFDVDYWNAAFPIGTPVAVLPNGFRGRSIVTKTKSHAWAADGGTVAVVMVEGQSTGVRLSHLSLIVDGGPR